MTKIIMDFICILIRKLISIG